MCGIPTKIAKLLLFTINFAVWICGGVIMGVGIALAVDEELWSEWFAIVDGMGDELFAAAIYMMISIGVLLFLVGFLGCCGVCKGNRCMLQTYIILVSILLAMELVGGILAIVFKDSLSEDIKTDMRKDIQEKYDGVNATDGVSLGWNSMQLNLECCGAYNYTDYEGSNWSNGKSEPVPITCCKGVQKKDNYYTISDADKELCFVEADGTPKASYSRLYARGCYQGLDVWISEKSDIIIGVLIGLGAVQLFGLIGACCVKDKLDDDMA